MADQRDRADRGGAAGAPLLTLPVTILTLGLFIFVLNGLLFWGVGSWLEGFAVAGFWSGVLGAILFSIVSWLLSALVLRAPTK